VPRLLSFAVLLATWWIASLLAGDAKLPPPPAVLAAMVGTESAGSQSLEPDGDAGAASGTGGPLRSRAQALQQLQQVAEFFRRTEPHSPVAYLAEKAARWGEMPLHVWLKRVIKDSSVLDQMEEMLDINQNLDGQ
jgi:type VI secretion system protein ImpA